MWVTLSTTQCGSESMPKQSPFTLLINATRISNCGQPLEMQCLHYVVLALLEYILGNVDFIGYEKGPGVAGCEDNELRPQIVLWIRCSTSHQIGISSGLKSKGTAILSRGGVTGGTNTSASNFPECTKIKLGWMESLCLCHSNGYSLRDQEVPAFPSKASSLLRELVPRW